jgi:hypothetical protein
VAAILVRFAMTAFRIGLNLPRRQEVAIVTLTLSLCSGFQRAQGSCAAKKHAGGQEKLVIRAL